MAKPKKKSSSKKKQTKFQYKPTSADRIKRQAEQTGSRFDGIFKQGVDVFKFKAGDNDFRILPPTWQDAEYYGYEVWVHSYVGANNGNYLCLQKMQGKRCPICDAAKEARDAGEKDEAAQLSATNRFLFYVVDRGAKAETPLIMDLSWSQDQAIAALCTSKRTGKVIAIDHPYDGRDVSISRRGQGINTKYYGHRIDSEASPIADDEDDVDNILSEISENPIPSLLHFQSEDYLEGIISGTASRDDEDDDDEDEDDEEEERKSKKKKKSTSKKKKKQEDEDDEDDEDDEEEYEDDEEEDEDDEEEDEDDEEEDEDDEDEEDDEEDDDEDDEEEDDDEEDEDEDEEPVKKKKGKKAPAKKPAKKPEPKKSGKSARAKRFGR